MVRLRDMFIYDDGVYYKVDDEVFYEEVWFDLFYWDVKGIKDIFDQYDKFGFKSWFYGIGGYEVKFDL